MASESLRRHLPALMAIVDRLDETLAELVAAIAAEFPEGSRVFAMHRRGLRATRGSYTGVVVGHDGTAVLVKAQHDGKVRKQYPLEEFHGVASLRRIP